MQYIHFSKSERMELSILRKKGYSLRTIAGVLGRSPSSVSREIGRNKKWSGYDPQYAQIRTRVRRRDAKYQGMKVRGHPILEHYLEEKIRLGWSPDVIAGTWKRERTKHGLSLTITAKGIYKYLYSPYGYQLCRFLKLGHCGRRKRYGKNTKKVILVRTLLDR